MRYVDLRLSNEPDGQIYIEHGLRGPAIDDVLSDIARYADSHPKEVIIVDAGRFTNFTPQTHDLFVGDMASSPYPVRGAANASQLPYLPLILRPDELDSGHIDHMLGIAIAKDRGTGYSWPARSGDGAGTNPDGVPMGTVFRLRADFDVSAYSLPTQVVLRALQEHGAVVFDSAAPGVDGAGLLAMSNGWTGTDHLTAQRELNSVPIAALEAVDVSALPVDPALGWQIVVSTP